MIHLRETEDLRTKRWCLYNTTLKRSSYFSEIPHLMTRIQDFDICWGRKVYDVPKTHPKIVLKSQTKEGLIELIKKNLPEELL